MPGIGVKDEFGAGGIAAESGDQPRSQLSR